MKQLIIEEWEELGDIKCQGNYLKIFNLFWLDKMSEEDIYISSWVLFETSKLIGMNEVLRYQMKLESFTNSFFN